MLHWKNREQPGTEGLDGKSNDWNIQTSYIHCLAAPIVLNQLSSVILLSQQYAILQNNLNSSLQNPLISLSLCRERAVPNLNSFSPCP